MPSMRILHQQQNHCQPITKQAHRSITLEEINMMHFLHAQTDFYGEKAAYESFANKLQEVMQSKHNQQHTFQMSFNQKHQVTV